ncbi:MAG TPA: universal stress protein [Polyangiaceae bacterium]
MKNWKNVFVNVDARPHTPYALEKSLMVAEAFRGRVSAFDSVSAADGKLPADFPDLRIDQLMDLAAAARAHELREELARIAPRVPVEVTVAKGSPASTLLPHARGSQADLILMAVSASEVRQRTPVGTAMLRLLREARVPLWVCSPYARRKSRVLAVVNLAGAAAANEHVVRAAVRLASLEQAELHILCVADQACRQVLAARSFAREPVNDERELRQLVDEVVGVGSSVLAPHRADAIALHTIEKAVLELEPDFLVLSRDGSDFGGLPGTYFVERLFGRVDSSMLLLPGQELATQKARAPRERWPGSGMVERASAASA